MERRDASTGRVRKIKLTHSEPLVYLLKQKEIPTVNKHLKYALSKRGDHIKFPKRNEQCQQQQQPSKHIPKPPQSVRPKITVVSPERRIRLTVKSPSEVCRSNADGESSPCSTDDEKVLSAYKFRYPGDGCNSDESSGKSSTGNEQIESNEDKDSDAETWKDDEVNMGQDSVLEKLSCTHTLETVDEDVEGYFYEDDITEDDKSSNTSLSTGFMTDDENDIRLNTSDLSWQFSKCTISEDAPLPILKSLFPNKPPTIYFTTEHEKVCQLPPEIRRVLKWKASTVTPKVVKSCIARSGFRITKRNSDWLGIWGKHMKPASFKSIQPHQKINHFPGTFHIGRKDKLWRNFGKMRIAFGKEHFNFMPQTYVLPHDINHLKKVWDEGTTRNKWIVKPPASARGSGIKVIHKWSQLPKKRPLIVQRYLSKPYLINGHKFDLRIYVYVSSFDPLRIYIFEDGLVRFATYKYSSSSKSLSNKYMHLTNYSINKKNKTVYTSNNNDDPNDAQKTFKWSLKALWKYFQNEGVNWKTLWGMIKDIAVKAVLCGESNVNTLTKQNISGRLSCHELFGLDIILDSKLKPWLLEVNISPSLHSNSDLDRNIKGQLVKDIFNMAGFFLPRSFLINNSRKPNNIEDITAEKFWFESRTLSSDEKAKHTYYVQRHEDYRTRATILDVITPDDLLMIMEAEDEFSRCGSFERLFPSCRSENYLKFIQMPRYNNILLSEWTKQYMRDTLRNGIGIAMLQSLAGAGIHLTSGAQVDLRHQWLLSHYGSARPQRVSNSLQPSFQYLSNYSPIPSLNRRRSTQSSHLLSRRPLKKGTTALNRGASVGSDTQGFQQERNTRTCGGAW